jgi:hypothetical protein
MPGEGNLAGLINNQLLYQSNQIMPNFQDDVIANQDYYGANSGISKLEKSVDQIERS